MAKCENSFSGIHNVITYQTDVFIYLFYLFFFSASFILLFEIFHISYLNRKITLMKSGRYTVMKRSHYLSGLSKGLRIFFLLWAQFSYLDK